MMKKLLMLLFFMLSGAAHAGHPDAAIYHAALAGDLCEIAKDISVGATLNNQYPFSQGRTPLMAAVIGGNWNAVNLLLRFGANPTIKNNLKGSEEEGWTALEYARVYKDKQPTQHRQAIFELLSQ